MPTLVVTGGAKGIGLGPPSGSPREGWDVAIADIDAEAGEREASRIGGTLRVRRRHEPRRRCSRPSRASRRDLGEHRLPRAVGRASPSSARRRTCRRTPGGTCSRSTSDGVFYSCQAAVEHMPRRLVRS